MSQRAIAERKLFRPSSVSKSARQAWIVRILLTLVFSLLFPVSPSRAASAIPVRTAHDDVKQPLQVFDREGNPCGVGEYAQTISRDDIIRVELQLDIEDNSNLREVVEMERSDVLQPVRFSYELTADDEKKRFEIDFKSGYAVRNDQNGGTASKKEAFLEFERARTFAGVMLILVALNFPEDQCELDLQVVAFTPGPKVVQLKMFKEAEEPILIGGREVPAVRYRLSPVLPAIVRVFVGDSKDKVIWLSQSGRPAFLRFEGSIELDGPLFRIESQRHHMAYESPGPNALSTPLTAAR